MLTTFSAILATGGSNNDDPRTSAEVILPDGRSCTMPDLPSPRDGHTQSGYTACGGGESYTWSTCDAFLAGQWEETHKMAVDRWYHVSWRSSRGTVLLGGFIDDAKETTELLSTDDTTTTAPFTLKYKTGYSIIVLFRTIFNCHRILSIFLVGAAVSKKWIQLW